MAPPINSEYMETKLTELSDRMRNAEAYFLMHPESGMNAYFQRMYGELKTRCSFIQDAGTFLTIMQDNRTNTDKALDYCEQLYQYSNSAFMYNTQADIENYFEAIAKLQKEYPQWDQKIIFAVRNISAAQQRGATVQRYHKALRIFVETVTEYFLWLRSIYAPIPEPKKAETRAIN